MPPDEVDKAISDFLAKIGAKGGRAKSAAKTASSRANAKKPRGPRKPKAGADPAQEGKE
jgi:hypothetical protein